MKFILIYIIIIVLSTYILAKLDPDKNRDSLIYIVAGTLWPLTLAMVVFQLIISIAKQNKE